MTDSELEKIYAEVVEHAVDAFDGLWTDVPEMPRSGFFDFRRYPDWTKEMPGYAGVVTIPGNGMIGFCYAVLLTETERENFGAKGVGRAVLAERLVRLLRWTALTSAYVERSYPFLQDTDPAMLQDGRWRRPPGFRADEIGYLTLAAAKIWPQLDAETRSLLEAMMVGGAVKERIDRWWYPPQGGNHDRVKQDLSSTMGAAFLFPHRPDAVRYRDVVRDMGLDMVSTLHDFARPAVAARARGWNLYPDYTSDHHGWAQVWYGADKLFEGRLFVELLCGWTGIQVPDTFTHAGNGYDGILERMKVLAMPEGELLSVHGAEYDSFYGSGVLVYGYGARLKGDPVAAALEERAAVLLRNHARALPVYDYHRNNWGKAALLWMLHGREKRVRPIALADAWRELEGTFHHPWQRNLLQRDAGKLTSFSWGSISSRGHHFGGEGSGFCGFVVPTAGLDPAAPALIYPHPRSLTGVITVTAADGTVLRQPQPATLYRVARDDAGFSTTGFVTYGPIAQTCAFISFADGPALFFNSFRAEAACELEWSGMPVYWFVRAGLAPARVFIDGSGRRALDGTPARSHTRWWCVDQTLGVILRDGEELIERRREVGGNWARTEAYRDRCDVIATSPVSARRLHPGDRAGRLAAVFCCGARDVELESADEEVKSLSAELPEGWSGIVAPAIGKPGLRFLAAANLDGSETTSTLPLGFPEGVPLIGSETVVSGKSGRTTLRLAPLASVAERLELYIETLHGAVVMAHRAGPHCYRIFPTDPAGAQVVVRYFGPAANTLTMRRLGDSDIATGAVERVVASGAILEIGAGVQMWIEGASRLDDVGPAVEITSVTVREDSQVGVTVAAHDQSGVAEVALYEDGVLIGKKDQPPYEWVAWPQPGYHTYFAVATDAAPMATPRKSDAQTVFVPPIRIPSD